MRLDDLYEGQLTYSVIGAFREVHRVLGFGFREHVYMMALERELRARGHQVDREVYVPVFYKGEELARERLDMVVDKKLVVEVKATLDLHKSARVQLFNYLKATKLEVGLLLHFGPFARPYRAVSRNGSIVCDIWA